MTVQEKPRGIITEPDGVTSIQLTKATAVNDHANFEVQALA